MTYETYEYAWKEMRKWLDESISYMKEREKTASGREYHRIKNKLEGLKVTQHYMNNSEKIYKLNKLNKN